MSRPNHHGYAALAREDVADAKAGTSGVDLRGYAAERGLEVIAGSLPAGGDAAVPRWPEMPGRAVSEVDQLVAASLRAARRYGLAAV